MCALKISADLNSSLQNTHFSIVPPWSIFLKNSDFKRKKLELSYTFSLIDYAFEFVEDGLESEVEEVPYQTISKHTKLTRPNFWISTKFQNCISSIKCHNYNQISRFQPNFTIPNKFHNFDQKMQSMGTIQTMQTIQTIQTMQTIHKMQTMALSMFTTCIMQIAFNKAFLCPV